MFPLTFEKQCRRGDGRFPFALIRNTEYSRKKTKLKDPKIKPNRDFLRIVTFRMCSDFTLAIAARALVDIFNRRDNATEGRRGYKTSLQLSPHPNASTFNCSRNLERSVEILLSCKSPWMGSNESRLKIG